MKDQSLEGVCNGTHLWNFSKTGQLWNLKAAEEASFSIAELEKKVKNHSGKAILILDKKKQSEIIEELEKLSKNKTGLVARNLSLWSKDADLWMVRYVATYCSLKEPWECERAGTCECHTKQLLKEALKKKKEKKLIEEAVNNATTLS